MRDQPTLTDGTLDELAGRATAAPVPGLTVLWSAEEPHLVGAFFAAHAPALLGRGDGRGDDEAPRATPLQIRPGDTARLPPIASTRVSRSQLRLEAEGDGVRLTNRGRCRLIHAGAAVDTVPLRMGEVVHLRNALVLRAERRPLTLPPLAWPPFPFGQADAFGIVGETTTAWALRRDLVRIARSTGHVLVRGPSGSGKELVARALRGLSDDEDRPFVARNASTFPETLIDAELFGNAPNFPNAGMPGRPGLVGEADGGVLFLDEIGELPEAMQARLLRVLDEGEYQRLGESRARRARVRVIGATNRPLSALKHDVLARFVHRIDLVGLDQRVADIPLLAAELLRRRAVRDPQLRRDWFDGDHPRLRPELVEALVAHPWTLHARELDRWLVESAARSDGTWLAPLDAVAPTPQPEGSAVEDDAEEPDEQTIRAALDAADGVVARAWRELKLRNRYQLYRLMKKHGIERS